MLSYVDEVLHFYLVEWPQDFGLGCKARGTVKKFADKIESDCSLVLLGSLMRELVEESLFPIPESNNILQSVKSLEATVTLLLTRIKPLGTGSEHEKCNGFPEIANSIRDDVLRKQHTTILTSSHRKHIADQAEKSGCDGIRRP